MNYGGVIFDLDGTLLDTLDDLAASMNRALCRSGFPAHPVDSYRYFIGQGMANLARAAAPADTAQPVLDALRTGMAEEYAKNWNSSTRPYQGIPEMLKTLRDRGLKLGILSNKPDSFTREMVSHYFPRGMFDAVQGALDSVPIKPDPTGAVMMARMLDVPPERLMYVGDTNTDMRTGLAAGMFTIGVTWGFRPEELAESGAMAVVSRPDEIIALLDA